MSRYTCEIEKVENGVKITRNFISAYGEGHILFPADILNAVAFFVGICEMNEGKITECKVNRDKDGTISVSVTGAQDRIFAKVWRADNA